MNEEEKCPCQEENPMDVSDIDPNVGPPPRVAEVEVCDNRVCETVHLLVRGNRVTLVSTEQAQRLGVNKADLRQGDGQVLAVTPDIRLPAGYVFVNDASGRLMSKCDIYVVKWRNSRRRESTDIHPTDLAVAEEYFGSGAPIRSGFVDLPKGPWKRVARVRFIQYSRFGSPKPFQHRYDPPVDLQSSKNPLAWKIPMPDGCIIDSRGFVRP